MNERDFANKIKQDLNYGLGQLPADVTARLKSAREQALQAFTAPESVQELALAGHGQQNVHHRRHDHAHSALWLSLLVLLTVLGGVWYWESTMQQEDDVDAALLASDLPLNSFIDHDFHSWLEQLEQSSQR